MFRVAGAGGKGLLESGDGERALLGGPGFPASGTLPGSSVSDHWSPASLLEAFSRIPLSVSFQASVEGSGRSKGEERRVERQGEAERAEAGRGLEVPESTDSCCRQGKVSTFRPGCVLSEDFLSHLTECNLQDIDLVSLSWSSPHVWQRLEEV